jgi:hypothetical protein
MGRSGDGNARRLDREGEEWRRRRGAARTMPTAQHRVTSRGARGGRHGGAASGVRRWGALIRGKTVGQGWPPTPDKLPNALAFCPGSNRDAGVRPRENTRNPPRIGPPKRALIGGHISNVLTGLSTQRWKRKFECRPHHTPRAWGPRAVKRGEKAKGSAGIGFAKHSRQASSGWEGSYGARSLPVWHAWLCVINIYTCDGLTLLRDSHGS